MARRPRLVRSFDLPSCKPPQKLRCSARRASATPALRDDGVVDALRRRLATMA